MMLVLQMTSLKTEIAEQLSKVQYLAETEAGQFSQSCSSTLSSPKFLPAHAGLGIADSKQSCL